VNAWDCSALERQRISLSLFCEHGTARYLSPRAVIRTANWRHLSERHGLAQRLKRPVQLDRAVTFAPGGDVVVAALASLRKGGVVAINAIHLDRIPEFDYDRLLWGERQMRSVTNMTRADARDFLQLAGEINLRPKTTLYSLHQANDALAAVKHDSIDGAAVIMP
jgi:D-arabinose 1-dehydrogenase-like Zn-dependent alcohol dehydrogenase